ncbi:cyclic nucleotide-binding domain-containing protein [Clostridium celatum]|uniref:Cyclic nucleotide-binding domain protein n=1 Tax=Clostridium celatum DSM 1785 TaxID=545697 RepID=L1Q6G8_9CLOT|nr:cyclic nucleotide-binding domain-containing protein [Clostridium celatum]EKY23290.1 cyclic nucleotide-binding domain protein [Clostridium celatum DSM 1785]MCE9655501.1 cyclic nucleotide-binding domain-containing protein [Clostridium celatum]MDU3723147.1 cyclic nucleotide-binding domain-containing protein [Clostridium celatum]MDU6296063.1 cyclic nucleotide-binding domain-containing protein [Clostridium celatum]MDY3361518.1 cyclic nucleotide-binding domain-containing protein [Clostridium cela
MKKLNNQALLNSYITKYQLNKYLNKNLLESLEIYTFDKNEYICTLNEELNYMYFLVFGKAKVTTLLSNGKSLLICFNNPLSTIGDLELLDNPIADCNVITLEKSICLGLPINKIHIYGYNDPIFLRFIISSLEEKLRKNSVYSSINILYPLENRFAIYLLSSLPSNLSETTIEIENINNLSQLLGSSYRHLTRVIKKLCSDNIIEKNKNTIKILNLPLLQELASDTYR